MATNKADMDKQFEGVNKQFEVVNKRFDSVEVDIRELKGFNQLLVVFFLAVTVLYWFTTGMAAGK